jgi:hypothetical protein
LDSFFGFSDKLAGSLRITVFDTFLAIIGLLSERVCTAPKTAYSPALPQAPRSYTQLNIIISGFQSQIFKNINSTHATPGLIIRRPRKNYNLLTFPA